MSFDVTVQHALKKLRRSLSALEDKAYPAAVVKTLNRTANSTKVASARHIAPLISSRQAAVKRRIEVRKATYKKLWAELVAKHRAIQLIDFVVGSKKSTKQPGGKRGVVKVRKYGKVSTLPNAFIAPRKSGSSKTTVYTRKKKSRLPLKLMYGPSIMSLFKQRENDAVMERTVRERFPVEFARNLAFYVKRIKQR